MSIEIDGSLCAGCGDCAEICPGSLIRMAGGVARIARPERCWACASCVKECPVQAVSLFLGADMGGLGGRMTVKKDGASLCWTVRLPDGAVRTITTDSRDANRY